MKPQVGLTGEIYESPRLALEKAADENYKRVESFFGEGEKSEKPKTA